MHFYTTLYLNSVVIHTYYKYIGERKLEEDVTYVVRKVIHDNHPRQFKRYLMKITRNFWKIKEYAVLQSSGRA